MSNSYTYQKLLGQFNNVKSRVEEFKNVPDDLFTLKPAADIWSAAEICNHLVQFNNLYLKQIDKAKNSLVISNEEMNSICAGFLYRQFIRFLEPPYKIKVKTIAPMSPGKPERSAEESIDQLMHTEHEVIERIIFFQNFKADLNRTRGKNPIIKWLPMSVADLLLVLDAHQRRHIWQMENTLFKLSGTKY